MRYQGKSLFNRVNLATAAIATVLAVMPLAGCGGGGGGVESSTVGIQSTQPPQSTIIDTSVAGDASLRSRAAAKGIVYGAAATTSALANIQFADAFANEAGMLVPESELKWRALRPTPDSYNFAAADSLLNYAQDHNLLFRGHTLVWHESLPAWFTGTVTSANAEQILKNHISTVVGRYAGKMHSWDVVNEAIEPSEHESNGLRSSSPWYQLLGPAYIEKAFHAAAEADPNALLVYNETWLDYDTPYCDAKRAAVLKLLTNLKAAGTPIHALGIQAHLEGAQMKQSFNPTKFKAFLDQVAALGLKIMITEMDVRDMNLPTDISTRDQIIGNIYRDYLTVVLNQPAVIAVVTWGLSDSYTWNSTYYPRNDGEAVRPLPLDSTMNRKLAWNGIAKAFDSTVSR